MQPKPFVPQPLETDARFVRDRTSQLVWHRTAGRTLYADTDRSQVIYHANYLRYFELGRATLMRDTGYTYRQVEADGFVYPIIQVGVDFFTPLRYDDTMWIHTRPATLERVRLRFDYLITHGESGRIVCTGFTRHCAVNANGTPVSVDPRTLHLWHSFPR
jgi:acyl-CoA thioester hydrolase